MSGGFYAFLAAILAVLAPFIWRLLPPTQEQQLEWAHLMMTKAPKDPHFSSEGSLRLRWFRERMDFVPRTVLDVGAHRGDWMKEVRPIFPEAEWFLVEANPDKRAELEKTGLPFEIAMLASNESGEATFYSTQQLLSQGASMYKERSDYYDERYVKKHVLPLRMLDNVVAASKLGETCCDLVKVDVQGAELEVLKGALRTLRNAKLLMVEMSLLEYNEGAPLFGETVSWLWQQGFHVVDVADIHYGAHKRTIQLDALLVPTGSPLMHLPYSVIAGR